MINPTYKPICRGDELIIGTGKAIIITGWTPKERVAKLLETHEYACIGNLYSSMYGLTPLVVNLLANPYSWDIYVLSATEQDKIAGASQCLYDLLTKSFLKESNGYIPLSEVKGIVDSVVPEEALRTSVSNLGHVEFYKDLENLLKKVKSTGKVLGKNSTETLQPTIKKYGEAIYVEIPKPESPTLPGDLCGHVVKGHTVAEVWLKAISLIRSTGRLSDSQYGERQELIQMTSIVCNEPADFYFEPWLPVTKNFMKDYLPYIVTSEISEGVSYTYGSKIRAFKWFDHLKDQIITTDQIEEVAKKLKANPDSSQCTISLWDVAADTYSKNPPCLTNIWVRLIDKRLLMIATFRSHDMYTAYPSNAMALRRLQDVLLAYLENCKAGELIINSQSAHIYEHSFQHADDVLKEHYKPKVNYKDPVGNFEIRVIIKLAELQVLVTQMTPAGQPVRTYYGNDALKIVREIAAANPSIQPDHLGYLGIELQKALERGQEYKQDSKK